MNQPFSGKVRIQFDSLPAGTSGPTVLVIDDVGLLPMPEPNAASAFFQVVNTRYEKRR